MTNIRYEPVKLALVYGCSGCSVSYLRVLPATKFWANIPLNTIFLFRHTLGNELDWVVCIEYWRTVSTDGFHAKSISEKFFWVFVHTHYLIFQIYSVCCVQDLLSGFICIALILGRAADPQSVVDVLLRLLSPKGFLPQPKF